MPIAFCTIVVTANQLVHQYLACVYNCLVCVSVQGVQPPVLIFVQNKGRAQQLYHEIMYEGLSVTTVHADRDQKQVRRILALKGTFVILNPRPCHHGVNVIRYWLILLLLLLLCVAR